MADTKFGGNFPQAMSQRHGLADDFTLLCAELATAGLLVGVATGMATRMALWDRGEEDGTGWEYATARPTPFASAELMSMDARRSRRRALPSRQGR